RQGGAGNSMGILRLQHWRCGHCVAGRKEPERRLTIALPGLCLSASVQHLRGKTMAQMKIYGSLMSRASRGMWCAKELGVPFDHIDVPWDKLKEPSFLAINPNGKVPGFEDGKLKLFESLAIILYLCKRYGTGKLYPADIEQEGQTFQWTLW